MLASGTPVQIIDTRPRHCGGRAQEIMEGAVWRDPERLDEWIGELVEERARGHGSACTDSTIGCETAATLRKAGFDARATWPAATLGGKPPKARRGSSTPRCRLPARQPAMARTRRDLGCGHERSSGPVPERSSGADGLRRLPSKLSQRPLRLLARGGCRYADPDRDPGAARHLPHQSRRAAARSRLRGGEDQRQLPFEQSPPRAAGDTRARSTSRTRATGAPWLCSNSAEITLQRTGAATAVAARYLARKDATTATICGCGEQGRIQLTALLHVLNLRTAFAWDGDAEAARAFARRMSAETGIAVQAVDDLGAATRASDAIVTCTTTREPSSARNTSVRAPSSQPSGRTARRRASSSLSSWQTPPWWSTCWSRRRSWAISTTPLRPGR